MSNWAVSARLKSTDAGYRQGEKLTGKEQEPELEITEEHRGREEEHVNWEQENKEADSGATGTEQVWWNSHEERQSLAWVTPAAPKVMKERARGGTPQRWGEEGEIQDAGKGISEASGALRRFVECFICAPLLLNWFYSIAAGYFHLTLKGACLAHLACLCCKLMPHTCIDVKLSYCKM